jgi:hypothetical protein
MNDRPGDGIRDKISANVLPRDRPEKIGTGHGAGDPCAACEEPIQAAPDRVSDWGEHPDHASIPSSLLWALVCRSVSPALGDCTARD